MPVAALYRADGGKLEGVLPIDQPPVLLGYQPGRGSGNGVQSKPALSVYIQFNPALAKPEPTPTDAGPGEDDATLRHAKNWEKECRAVGRHAKQRPYRALATDAMGRSVLLRRYCAPATLPPGFEGAVADDATLRRLLRFVHLVPRVTDMDAFNLPPGMDIWTTSAEFLDMCAGDSEEHALLMLGFCGSSAWRRTSSWASPRWTRTRRWCSRPAGRDEDRGATGSLTRAALCWRTR